MKTLQIEISRNGANITETEVERQARGRYEYELTLAVQRLALLVDVHGFDGVGLELSIADGTGRVWLVRPGG